MADGADLLLGPGGLAGFTVHTDREPNPGTRRLMDWLGVEIDVTTARKPRPRAQLLAEIAEIQAEGPMTSREIGARLGLSAQTIRNALSDPDDSKRSRRRERYQGQCVDCGVTTYSDGTSRPSPRCGPCAVEANRIYDRDSIIEVIREFARIHGRPPLSTEWLRRDNVKPHVYVATCQAVFGSWANAIEAAGFPRPQMGRKVLPMGQGRNHMKRTYYVLHKNGDQAFHAVTVEAYSPEQAIEQVADSEGEWVAVLDRYWVKATVATQTKLAVVKA